MLKDNSKPAKMELGFAEEFVVESKDVEMQQPETGNEERLGIS